MERLENYWYLREGDYLVEPLSSLFGGKGPRKEFIRQMWRDGMIFDSEEEATVYSKKIREMFKKRVRKQVYIMDFSAWTITVLTPFAKEEERVANWIDTLRYVRHYLRYGKGSLRCRLTSVLIKALTFSLKPRQASSSKEDTSIASFTQRSFTS
ncbi:hypothetical protein ACTQ43_07310 [Segatella copri]|uniref:hypothetical protein n=1 Tax=Segatella copri TaxID=165179 RepID=UPI003F989FAD